MTKRATRNPERQSEMLDVQLLDVLATVEALLRGGRDVQREALRVRGVPTASSRGEKLAAARRIRTVTQTMKRDSAELQRVMKQLRRYADLLYATIRSDRRLVVRSSASDTRRIAADKP